MFAASISKMAGIAATVAALAVIQPAEAAGRGGQFFIPGGGGHGFGGGFRGGMGMGGFRGGMGGFHGGFAGSPAFRGGFAGSPAFHSGFAGGPAFGGFRGHRFFGHHRGFVGPFIGGLGLGLLVGGGPYYDTWGDGYDDYSYGDCPWIRAFDGYGYRWIQQCYY